MKRPLWLALLLLLAACTGTQSEQPPILLFVTHSAAGVHTAALIEDYQFADPRFTYLEDTETELAGAPVAFDVADRAGSRNEIVLLLETGSNAYSAVWYDMEEIIPANAGPLSEARPGVDLAAVLQGEVATPEDLCLTDLQVTHDGLLLALLNDPGACGMSATPSIFLVDADGNLVRELFVPAPLPTGVYIRQVSSFDGPDMLYFLDQGIQAARLVETELPAGAPISVDPFNEGSDLPVPHQLTFSAGSFLAVQPDTLYVHSGSNLTLQPSSPNNVVIPDAFGDQLPALLVLRTGSSSQLRVFADGASLETVDRLGTVSAGTVQPIQQWVYLLRAGDLQLVDLLAIVEGTGDGNPRRSVAIPEIGTPGIITWFEGLLEVAPVVP